eukprot:m.31779 g.31779  ORF g.31779 m.31779 type:complete len:810 (-) comp10719_c0_seq1:453-2882(-)
MTSDRLESAPLISSSSVNTDSRARSKRYSHNVHMWSLLAITIITLALGGGVGIGLVGRAFSKLCTNTPCALARAYQGCFDAAPFIGVLLLTFVLPMGVLSLGSLVIEFANKLGRWGKLQVVIALGTVTLASVVIVILTWIYLLKPTTVFKVRPDGIYENDVLQALIGGFIMLTFTPLSIVCMVVIAQVWRFRYSSLVRIPQDSPSSITPSGWKNNRGYYFGLILFMMVLAVCCSSFSSVWNFSATSYFPWQSPYAAVQVKVTDKFYFKLYSDTIVYYGFIGFIATIGCLVHFNRGLRQLMHVRFVVGGPLRKYVPGGITVGEGILGLLTFVLFAYWFWFWRWGYSRIEQETGPSSVPAACCDPSNKDPNATCTLPADEHSQLQIWARVLGHMTTLSMSLLLLPVARNSVWDHIFGVPFERAIGYHRGLGVVAYTFLTVHMLLWLIKWGIEGTLKNNLWTLDYLQITPEVIHYDNFTIIIAEITWVLVTAMVFIALFARRNNYQLFYYSHHIAIIFYVVAISHAWSFWYYAIGGLLLWFLDRCIRIIRKCEPAVIQSITTNKQLGVTTIHFSKSHFKYYAGQYAWISVPCISHMEWHPFTISSAPSSDKLTFHIKDMGPDTFTSKVLQLTDDYPLDAIRLRVDGPYGRPLYFDEAKTIVLVAGGIGVTPLHSILMEIYHRAQDGRSVGSVQHVCLVWAVRQAEMLHLFQDMLEVVGDKYVSVKFEFDFYITGAASFAALGPTANPGREELEEVASSLAKAGRPDLKEIASRFPHGASTMLMVCGPEEMIQSASDTAAYYDFSFHHEVFTF